MIDELTGPERAAEIHLRRRLMPLVFECGGCRMCAQRIEDDAGWADCGLVPQRKFPACVEQPGGFELDRTRRAA